MTFGSDRTKSILKWLLVAVTTFLILPAAVLAVTFSYQTAYAHKIYRGIKIGFFDVSGLTSAQASVLVNDQAAVFNADGLPFEYQNHEVRVQPSVSSADPDLSYDVFSFDVDDTVARAYQLGRQGAWLDQVKAQGEQVIYSNNIDASYALDDAALLDVLKTNFSQYEKPAVNAKLKFVAAKPTVIPAQLGEVFDYSLALKLAKQNLANLSYSTIALSLIDQQPSVLTGQGQALLDSGVLNTFLAQWPIKITYQDKSWTIPHDVFVSSVDFDQLNGKITFALKGKAIEDYIASLAKKVDQPAKEAKFQITDNKVSEFQAGQTGFEVSTQETIDAINFALSQGQKEASLVVEKVEPQVTTANAADLGIKEIIGVGTSNFARSPVNRRHNIAVGAAAVNGTLIKPGEEFSLLQTLGKVDASTGYLQELVIKGNKTVPEYGGGLCQIGTTTFRAALGTGLPITERQNHSYRVVYYEPAGTDATIYFPKPDMRFTNDTGHYILIQTHIAGDILTFEFWGTKDGRVVDETKPVLYNITAPPPQATIETTDLPVGKKKCTEIAHAGADASFDYKVTYSNGDVKDEVFKSHYRPWQAVCLVGVAPGTGTSDSTGGVNGPTGAPVLLTPDLPVIPGLNAPTLSN